MSDDFDGLMKRIFGRAEPEDLCAELEQAKVVTGNGTAIRHRLVDVDVYAEPDNAWYNKTLREQSARAAETLENERWWDFVDTHPKRNWPHALEEIEAHAPELAWCETVRNVWYLSDELSVNSVIWRRIFANRNRAQQLMTPGETETFDAVGNPIEVFRGCLPKHVNGMSWSTSRDAVEHFKREAGPGGVIYRGVVQKDDVIAYINPNNEEYEIIVLPEHVSQKEIVG